MPLSRGERFGRFVVEAFLGRGGMGEVYRAFDTVLERKVALKLLGDGRDSTDAAANILREARAAAALEHPNVVSIYDVGEANGTPYLAMEYVAGSSLRSWIGAALPLGLRIRIVLDVARALAAAHRAGIIHRDVKPENVMIRGDGVVKVLDFGIARRRSGLVNPHAQTVPVPAQPSNASVAVYGTPSYMAAEQMRGEPVDARADQFSWGVLAYELVLGTRPWAGEGIEMVASMLSLDPSPPSGRDPTIPPALEEAITRALSRAREARFPSMDTIVTLLEPLATASSSDVTMLANAPVTAKESVPTRTEATRTASSPAEVAARPRARWALAGGIAAAALVTAVTLVARRPSAPDPGTAIASDAGAPKTAPPEAPISRVPEAAASYASAMDASRRAAPFATSIALFRDALRADPTLAAAHLRIAIELVETGEMQQARAELMAAIAGRSAMSERDAAILDASVPCILPDPVDPVRCRDAAAKLADARTSDAEISFLAGLHQGMTGQTHGSIPYLVRTTRLDPTFAEAWMLHAEEVAYDGDLRGAQDVLDECMKRVPVADACLTWKFHIEDQVGDRASCERHARALRAMSPESPRAHRLYASTLLADDQPVESVLEVLAKSWSVLPEGERALREERDRAFVDAYEGNLDQAIARLDRSLDAIVASSDPWRWRRDVALYLGLLEETGRAKDGAARAAKLQKRLAALESNTLAEDWAVAEDPLPILLDAEVAGGALSPAELDSARASWMRSWDARLDGYVRAYPWVYAWAELARTPDDAKAAIAARTLEGPPFRPLTATNASLGRMHLLAGDRARALPLLRDAANACDVLSYPLQATRALVLLGDAIASDDKPSACAAYAEVVARWGKGRRSMTLDRAKAGMRRAGCP